MCSGFLGDNMNDQDIKFMELAYKQAQIAYQNDEVPIGAIVVKDDEVISSAYNQREQNQMVTDHAETIAIMKACQVLHTWRLEGCTLYTTLEPCIMCSGVIINSRIQRVVYGARETRWLSLESLMQYQEPLNHKPEIVGNVLGDKCSKIIKKYFKNKR